jgi:hypothetical protein
MTSKNKLENQGPEIDYEDMLLKRFRITESVIEEAKKYNSEHGIDEAASKANVVFNKTNRQKEYERWLKRCKNPDTNEWYTMDFLKAKRIVARIPSPYDGIQYPRREMFNLSRRKESSGEYLDRKEMWYGMNAEGKEISLYVETLDNHMDLQIQYPKLENPDQNKYMGEEEELPGYGKTVARVSNTNRIYTDQEEGTLVYDTPFTQEAVREAVKYARGAYDDRNNGCALSITDKSRDSVHSFSVFSLEQFQEPFDQLFEKLSQPPKDKVDVKDLIKQLQEEKLLSRSKEANEVGVL